MGLKSSEKILIRHRLCKKIGFFLSPFKYLNSESIYFLHMHILLENRYHKRVLSQCYCYVRECMWNSKHTAKIVSGLEFKAFHEINDCINYARNTPGKPHDFHENFSRATQLTSALPCPQFPIPPQCEFKKSKSSHLGNLGKADKESPENNKKVE